MAFFADKGAIMSVLIYRLATFGPAMVRSFLFLLLFTVLFSACGDADKPQNASENKRSHIRPWKMVCLGGSITIGQDLSPDEAYPAVLAELLESSDQPVKVVNAGISGETVAGAASRISWILQQRIDVLLLALGEEAQDRALSIDQELQHWQQLLTTVRNAYPELPVYVLVMDNDSFELNSGAWAALKSDFQLEYLEPEWTTFQLRENKLTAQGHAELAEWLASSFSDLPFLYYEQNAQ